MSTTTTTPAHVLSVATRRADTSDFFMIHGCLRRATAAIVRAAPTIHAADRRRAAAFHRYWVGFLHELEHHHTVEDDVLFPALAERAADVADTLAHVAADHHRIDELMAEALDSIEAVTERGTHSMLRLGAFQRFDALLGEHLDLEERLLIPRFPELFGHDEYEAFTQQAMKLLSPRQALFTVPFIADNADPDVFTQLLATAPLPLRVVHRATRRGHARLADLALGADRRELVLPRA